MADRCLGQAAWWLGVVLVMECDSERKHTRCTCAVVADRVMFDWRLAG
jgi:hypothetical protein